MTRICRRFVWLVAAAAVACRAQAQDSLFSPSPLDRLPYPNGQQAAPPLPYGQPQNLTPGGVGPGIASAPATAGLPAPASTPPPGTVPGSAPGYPTAPPRGTVLSSVLQPQSPAAQSSAELSRSIFTDRLVESTWYARVDYFHWNERLDGADFVNEDGTLVTLGYTRRIGIERFRVELFGGGVNYDGATQADDGSSEPLKSTTNYLGVRGEYDLMLEPDWWPQVSFFVGVGTRFWIRSLPNDMLPSGDVIQGYQETWWTVYPYVGIEKRRVAQDGIEWFCGGRIGCTPVTFEHATLFDVVLHPRPGITGQLEAGLRGKRFHLSAFFEAMTWEQSHSVQFLDDTGNWSEVLQPASRQVTVGIKSGFSF